MYCVHLPCLAVNNNSWRLLCTQRNGPTRGRTVMNPGRPTNSINQSFGKRRIQGGWEGEGQSGQIRITIIHSSYNLLFLLFYFKPPHYTVRPGSVVTPWFLYQIVAHVLGCACMT